jgi:hypothetical protein
MHIAATAATAITRPLPPSIRATPPHITPYPAVTAQRRRWWPDELIRAITARASARSISSVRTSRTSWSTRLRSS